MKKRLWATIMLITSLALILDLSLSIANASFGGVWFSGIVFLLCEHVLPKGKTGFTILFSIIVGLVLGTNLGAVSLSYFFFRLISPLITNVFVSLLVESLGFFSLFALLSSMSLPINFILINAVLSFVGMVWVQGKEKVANYNGYSL